MCFKRAGADVILTYYAKQAAKWLKEDGLIWKRNFTVCYIFLFLHFVVIKIWKEKLQRSSENNRIFSSWFFPPFHNIGRNSKKYTVCYIKLRKLQENQRSFSILMIQLKKKFFWKSYFLKSLNNFYRIVLNISRFSLSFLEFFDQFPLLFFFNFNSLPSDLPLPSCVKRREEEEQRRRPLLLLKSD